MLLCVPINKRTSALWVLPTGDCAGHLNHGNRVKVEEGKVADLEFMRSLFVQCCHDMLFLQQNK